MAFLGIFAVVILTAINPFRQIQKARDAQRLNDLREIQVALNEFKTQFGRFPDDTSQLVGTWLKKVPKDPKTGEEYQYLWQDQDFQLCIQFEVGGEKCFASKDLIEVLPMTSPSSVIPQSGNVEPYGVL